MKKRWKILLLILSPILLVVTSILFMNKYFDINTSNVIYKDCICVYEVSPLEMELNIWEKDLIKIEGNYYRIAIKNILLRQYLIAHTIYLLASCFVGNMIAYVIIKKTSFRSSFRMI